VVKGGKENDPSEASKCGKGEGGREGPGVQDQPGKDGKQGNKGSFGKRIAEDLTTGTWALARRKIGAERGPNENRLDGVAAQQDKV